jgi:uncharacterized membrane protein YfcA
MLLIPAILSAAVGLSLGLLGGGGSILAVPVLIYAAGVSPSDAVGMSLALVGATSVVASVAHRRSGQVDLRTAILFGGAGMAAAFGGAQLTHRVPERVLLLLFAGLMLVVGALMALRRRAGVDVTPATVAPALPPRAPSLARTLAAGAGVGALTGFLGVGGGFLIVPALVAFAGLPIRRAVGTSLVVIALNSAAGFVGHIGRGDLHLGQTALFTAVSVAGALAGEQLASRVSADQLRRGFAAFVVVVGLVVAGRTLIGR